jgi:uncharacterized protein (TIGR03118 family)
MFSIKTFGPRLFAIVAIGFFLFSGCKNDTVTTTNASYVVTYLVSDSGGYGNNVRIDQNLKNAWGIAVSPTGNFWITANHTGTSVIYDANGNQVISAITIPSRDSIAGGEPTGIVYNPTPADFRGNLYIMAGEDGSLSAWTGGASAVRVYKNQSEDAVYKGIALAKDGANSYLYVTNFKERKIEVFDNNFSPSQGSRTFADASIPAEYGPFGITAIDGKLYVTYAKMKGPDNEDDEAGPGNGYVNIFNPDGTLYKHFVSGGSLNSPWGIAQASDDFGTFKGNILIGNFGDGAINAYDANGGFLGQLKDNNGNVIHIEGLWAMVFSSAGSLDKNTLYFAAGPGDEEHGLFGSIKFK